MLIDVFGYSDHYYDLENGNDDEIHVYIKSFEYNEKLEVWE